MLSDDSDEDNEMLKVFRNCFHYYSSSPLSVTRSHKVVLFLKFVAVLGKMKTHSDYLEDATSLLEVDYCDRTDVLEGNGFEYFSTLLT